MSSNFIKNSKPKTKSSCSHQTYDHLPEIKPKKNKRQRGPLVNREYSDQKIPGVEVLLERSMIRRMVSVLLISKHFSAGKMSTLLLSMNLSHQCAYLQKCQEEFLDITSPLPRISIVYDGLLQQL